MNMIDNAIELLTFANEIKFRSRLYLIEEFGTYFGRQFWVIPMRPCAIPASRNRTSCQGSIFLAFYEFRLIQFSDNFISDG